MAQKILLESLSQRKSDAQNLHQTLVPSLPKTIQPEASRILTQLQKNPEVELSDADGTISINGEVLRDSLRSLVLHRLQGDLTKRPLDYDRFLQVLEGVSGMGIVVQFVFPSDWVFLP